MLAKLHTIQLNHLVTAIEIVHLHISEKYALCVQAIEQFGGHFHIVGCVNVVSERCYIDCVPLAIISANQRR